MIRFHPSARQLTDFVEGTLSPAISLMVSAHCDMCDKCQRFVEVETERLAKDLVSVVGVGDKLEVSFKLDEMLSQITLLPTAPQIESKAIKANNAVVSPRNQEANISQRKATNAIELDGRVFTLPRTLHRYIDKTGNWSSLVGKLWQAPVDLGNQGVANFIFMGRGGSVPEHTHRGTEYTLVIDGEFSDGLNRYDTGDFIFMDGEKTHTPKSEDKDGCLVFSIVDQPLHFTSGLARLLNPFSHMFFR
ncbi:ChrR family anti-sigma-E factor [Alteromonas mediterranea]|uniref:ChrR family anti-sigma-E factor n=1 Tax=Alteromonas mediterranea TaxID=314275 RepID=UPI002FE2D132